MDTSVVLKITLLSLFAIPGTYALASSDPSVFIVSPKGNVELDMKATETREVSGFAVKPENVVQITEGDNLVVFSVPADIIDNVKITDSAGKRNELVPLGNNQYSLSAVPPGVYVLDVIVNLPDSSERAAYETILVILEPGQPVQNVQQIIQKVKVITDVRVTFEEDDDDDDGCSDKPGSAGLKFPQDKRTECEKREYDECQENRKISGREWGGGRCDNMYELFWDDDCFGFNNAKECDDYFNDRDTFCLENPNHKKCPKPEPILDCKEGFIFHNGKCKPICGEGGYEPGELCIDDGDEITCDGPFVPRGNECVPPDEPEYPICPAVAGDNNCDGIPDEPKEPDTPVYDDGNERVNPDDGQGDNGNDNDSGNSENSNGDGGSDNGDDSGQDGGSGEFFE